jgi:hypothetical protein
MLVNDSRRQVGLAGAGGAAKDQPAAGISGESPGGLAGAGELLLGALVAAAPFRQEIIEGEAR